MVLLNVRLEKNKEVLDVTGKFNLINDLRVFFNSKKGREILEQSEKDLKEEFITQTGMFSPEEDEAWEYLKSA